MNIDSRKTIEYLEKLSPKETYYPAPMVFGGPECAMNGHTIYSDMSPKLELVLPAFNGPFHIDPLSAAQTLPG